MAVLVTVLYFNVSYKLTRPKAICGLRVYHGFLFGKINSNKNLSTKNFAFLFFL